MWELDYDGGSEKVNQSVWKQMLQEDTWHIILYRENQMNEYVVRQVNIIVRHQERLLSNVRRRKLSRFCHVCCNDTLPKSYYIHCGSRRRGSPRKSRKDNIKEWIGQSLSSLQRTADDRTRLEAITTTEWELTNFGVGGLFSPAEIMLTFCSVQAEDLICLTGELTIKC